RCFMHHTILLEQLQHGGKISYTCTPVNTTSPGKSSRKARTCHETCKHLNTLGAKAVLAFSTMVPLSEIAFAVLLLPYLLLATLAFPQRPGKPNPSLPVFLGLARLLLAAHTVGGFLVGAALPALYVLDGLRSGDTTGIAAAAPHAFLLSAQVFIEGLTTAVPWRFSLPVRATVPVMYSARRMFVAGEWLRQEMEGVTAATGREGAERQEAGRVEEFPCGGGGSVGNLVHARVIEEKSCSHDCLESFFSLEGENRWNRSEGWKVGDEKNQRK
uniref:DUF7733 domain-containing protein n=1 Tax=Aegilops tauschii subsp. strangulata TaxID=200361 RepID=A0A453RT95_AEGTS